MATRADVKMVTGKINGMDVTVPAGTTILEAARSVGIDIPNLCYQPLLRPWGSCRICTVEILGKRGGLIESCATPLGEGMEVQTHSEPTVDARQFVLQMYLIDHALDCPTCDKSGECYLQDNTYLHNVNANPYRRPKFAQPYVHFSDLIDYKWDRCIMCNRCTRVCDEVIGVTAIESTYRSLEATISPAYGQSLDDTTCTRCGMCISVCPVGALTDRKFGHHPWELEATETICGGCDVGCTINVESNKGIVRRITNLWERGVNHGYLCEHSRWGYEKLQSPDRIFYPYVKDDDGGRYEVTWDDAINATAETLAHYQGDQFAALVSPESTNEEIYALQMFTRAVMGTNNVDVHLTPAQRRTAVGVEATLGADISNTNNMQELFTDVKATMAVGPDLGKTAPIASYWFYHSRTYREAKTVVISMDEYPLARRGEFWLKPAPGTTALLLNGMARAIVDAGLGSAAEGTRGYREWLANLDRFDVDSVSEATGVDSASIRAAAILWATGGAGLSTDASGYPPALIYQTIAHQQATSGDGWYGDPAEIAAACANLALLTGNIGRAGGGVAALRGAANYQGATLLGASPVRLPGGGDVESPASRDAFSGPWLSLWGEKAKTSNGFVPVRTLPAQRGLDRDALIAAIQGGSIKAMIVDGSIAGRHEHVDADLAAALGKLEFLAVIDAYNSPLAEMADVVLPKAVALEKDGTFTSFDRTVQRVRAAVPAMGEARPVYDFVSLLADRMGYGLTVRPASQWMSEIGNLVPFFGGVTYARLERDGIPAPSTSYADPGTPILTDGADGQAHLSLAFAGN
ncbi:MAG: molybdopterin-dependent oxidoreductase [Chloroflexota bacterium]|nr:molybdopterin-dependent oxidoreductase [Chloroflexota bacterium]